MIIKFPKKRSKNTCKHPLETNKCKFTVIYMKVNNKKKIQDRSNLLSQEV